MFAVVATGGKQYRVEAGSELLIERVPGEAGSTITFDRVLLVGDGDDVTVGTPTIAGATVTGTVIGEAIGPKLVVFKFKQKVKYRRHAGHRQHLTRVRIDEVSASGRAKSKAPAKADTPADAPAEPAEKPAQAARGRTAKTAPKADAKAATPKRTRRTTAAKPKAAEAEE